MTKKQAINWYESLPDISRNNLQKDFEVIYDNLGSRESKFYKWLMGFKKNDRAKYIS